MVAMNPQPKVALNTLIGDLQFADNKFNALFDKVAKQHDDGLITLDERNSEFYEITLRRSVEFVSILDAYGYLLNSKHKYA